MQKRILTYLPVEGYSREKSDTLKAEIKGLGGIAIEKGVPCIELDHVRSIAEKKTFDILLCYDIQELSHELSNIYEVHDMIKAGMFELYTVREGFIHSDELEELGNQKCGCPKCLLKSRIKKSGKAPWGLLIQAMVYQLDDDTREMVANIELINNIKDIRPELPKLLTKKELIVFEKTFHKNIYN